LAAAIQTAATTLGITVQVPLAANLIAQAPAVTPLTPVPSVDDSSNTLAYGLGFGLGGAALLVIIIVAVTMFNKQPASGSSESKQPAQGGEPPSEVGIDVTEVEMSAPEDQVNQLHPRAETCLPFDPFGGLFADAAPATRDPETTGRSCC
jgi:hypothetical protein